MLTDTNVKNMIGVPIYGGVWGEEIYSNEVCMKDVRHSNWSIVRHEELLKSTTEGRVRGNNAPDLSERQYISKKMLSVGID